MKKILSLIPVFLLILLMAGCLGTSRGIAGSPVGNNSEQTENNLKEAAGHLSGDNLTQEDSRVKAGAKAGEVLSVVLFFADHSGSLVPERREIPKVAGIARETMAQLCRGPGPEKGLMPTIPAGTEVKSINIKDGLATVDFSGELKRAHRGGSSGELLTVYSIVNTLTQFASVKRVQILVDGRIVDTLAGHLDISQPLERDSGMIKGSK